MLRQLASKQIAAFRRDAESAKKLLAVGDSPAPASADAAELAAWTMVASTIMNLDEAITRE